MNRDREAFFSADSPFSSDSPQSFFGRESPFLRQSRPGSGFEEFGPDRTNFTSPSNLMGFPTVSDQMDSSRKSSAPPQNSAASNSSNTNQAESIPIRVIHEKHKYAPGPHSRTTDLPAPAAPQRGPPEAGPGSPRVTRAHSEPPKAFNQRLLKTKIPLGNVSEQNEHNPMSTSASEPSVPHSQSDQNSISGNGGGTSGPNAAPKQAATSGSAEPTIRHIPIRVEGREEPINVGPSTKKPSDFYPSNVKVERRGNRENHAPPNTLKVNNSKNVQNQEPTSPLSPIPSVQPIPMGYHDVNNIAKSRANKSTPTVSGASTATSGSSVPSKPTSGPAEPQPPTAPTRRAASAAPTEQEPVSVTPIPMPCSPDYLQNQDKPSQNQSQQAQTCPGSASALAASTASVASAALKASEAADAAKEAKAKRAQDPTLSQLDKIMDNVYDLEKQISAFKGAKDSKEYRFLDEMLTRNLLALDCIDTAGRDDVRQQRKESIKSINRCLSVLESKAKTQNQAETNNAILSELAQQSSSK